MVAYEMLGTKYEVLSTKYQVLSTRYKVARRNMLQKPDSGLEVGKQQKVQSLSTAGRYAYF